jgi:hypothetical protein
MGALDQYVHEHARLKMDRTATAINVADWAAKGASKAGLGQSLDDRPRYVAAWRAMPDNDEHYVYAIALTKPAEPEPTGLV